MKKTLLYLEDNGFLLKQTVMFLEEDGYEVIRCSRIDLAINEFRNNKDKIDCIITDLNMDDQWLGKEYMKESNGGFLSGWVWLERFVYAEKENASIPCIIYSGYIPVLREHLTEVNKLELLEQYNVHCVEKGGGDDNGYMALYEELKKIIP